MTAKVNKSNKELSFGDNYHHRPSLGRQQHTEGDYPEETTTLNDAPAESLKNSQRDLILLQNPRCRLSKIAVKRQSQTAELQVIDVGTFPVRHKAAADLATNQFNNAKIVYEMYSNKSQKEKEKFHRRNKYLNFRYNRRESPPNKNKQLWSPPKKPKTISSTAFYSRSFLHIPKKESCELGNVKEEPTQRSQESKASAARCVKTEGCQRTDDFADLRLAKQAQEKKASRGQPQLHQKAWSSSEAATETIKN